MVLLKKRGCSALPLTHPLSSLKLLECKVREGGELVTLVFRRLYEPKYGFSLAPLEGKVELAGSYLGAYLELAST